MKGGRGRYYDHNQLSGCVEQRRNRVTGFIVGIYQAEQAGMEADEETPWATVCEEHNTLVCHATLALARSHAGDPEGWCEGCRKGYLFETGSGKFVQLCSDGKAIFTSSRACASLIEQEHVDRTIESYGLATWKVSLEWRRATHEDIEHDNDYKVFANA